MFSWGEINFEKPNGLAKKQESGHDIQFISKTKPIITSFSATNSTVSYIKSDVSYVQLRQRDQDGHVTFGNTQSVKSKPVVESSCGDSCLLLLSRDGTVVCVDPRAPSSPRSLVHCVKKRVLQVACGDLHSIVLTEDGQALTWGSNARGQLGLSLPLNSVQPAPVAVARLWGVPLVQVAAGGGHTLALSVSGTVFSWGQNDAGQLGVGDTTDRSSPVTVESLNLKKTISISCGERHTAVLTKDGLVLTCGSGACGQLGHNSVQNELRPRMVAELWGAAVTQVSCGSNHTMVLVGPTKKIYSFGRGAEGQLGNGVTTDCPVPLPVLLPGDDQSIQRIFAGGNQSFALCSGSQGPEKGRPGITVLDQDTINFWLSKRPNAKQKMKIKKQIKDIFTSTSSLNASLLDRRLDMHYQTSARCSGLDVALVTSTFDLLATNPEVRQEVEGVVRDCLLPSLRQPVWVEGLRVYYMLVGLLQVLVRDNHGEQLSVGVAEALLSLDEHNLEVLVGLWSRTPTFFRSAVKTFCNAAMKHSLPLDMKCEERTFSFKKTVKVLQRLYAASRQGSRCLAESVFHVKNIMNTIQTFVDLCELEKGIKLRYALAKPEYTNDEQRIINNTGFYLRTLLNLVEFPGILSFECKLELWNLHLINTKRSQPVVTFTVNRASVKEDMFQWLRITEHDPKSKLKVKFLEEDGIDEGGVSLEFFDLLAKHLQKAESQILNVNEHGVAWFSHNVSQLTDEFFLLGQLCGMALYNQSLINLPFPLAFFKKLLDLKPSLDDLMELSPTVAQGLQELLLYEEEVVEDLQLDFGAPAEDLELLPNGESIPVSKVNRQTYVDLYVDMVFRRSFEYQFEEFRRGFLRCCPTLAWRMFLPDQLMTLLKGEEIFNWDDLRQNAQYIGCTSNHEVIQNFWSVFAEFSMEQKKDFLKFLTASDRIPRGRSSIITIKIKLSCYPEPELYYPIAETCFWTLNLPNYSNIHTLRQKLLHAVECYEGFGRQ